MAGDFPVVGSQLEARGASEYVRSLREAAVATGSDFAREAQRGAAAMLSFAREVQSGVGAMLASTREAQRGSAAMRSAADDADDTRISLGEYIEALAVGMGQLWKQVSIGALVFKGVTSTVGFVVNAVKTLVGGAQQAVAAHERLSLSMESLVARELRAADSTMSMAQAMEVAKPRTQELLEWIQQLAIQSPFDTEGVALAFRTALTYGFVSKEAQALTQAMIDFASASGQSGHVMNQIAYALGQIKARGKLAGQEILQLTNAGVAVNPILKKMGFTINDVSKGLVSADAFLSEFVKTMNDEFGGAAKRQTETLTGLINSLGDIQKMSAVALFKPLSDQVIVPVLSGIIGKFQALIPTLKVVGQTVADVTQLVVEHKDTWLRAFDAILAGVIAFYAVVNAGAIWRAGVALVSTAVEVLVSAVGAMISALFWLLTPVGMVTTAITLLGVAVGGLVAMFAFTYADLNRTSKGFFEGMRENFFEWGKNLVVSLAKGMAAAIGAVISVLTWIGKIITGWLQGHSPPRLLPDIDKWGMGAMQTYLEGFTKADFGVLSSLSNVIGSYLRGLDLSEGDVLGRVLGARTDLTSIIDEINRTGSASEASYARLFATIGAGNPELESYIRLSVEAAAIQDRLTAASKRYADLLKPISEQMDDIGRRREEILSAEKEKALTRLLANPHISAQAKELAQLELQELLLKRQASAIEDQAKTETEADRERLDGLTEQLDSQQALIDSINETNNLLRQQAELARQATAAPTGGAEGGGAGGTGGLPAEAGGLLGALPDLASQAPGMMDNIKNAIVGIIDEIKGDFAALAPKWDEMKTVWQGALLSFFEWLAGIDWGGMAAGVAEFFQNIVISFLSAVQGMFEGVAQMFGSLAAALAQTGIPPLMTLSEGFDTVASSAGDAARGVRDQIKEAEGMADSARAAGEKVGDYFSNLRDDIKGKIYIESLEAFDNMDHLMVEYGDTVSTVQTDASADMDELGGDAEELEVRSDASYREMMRQIKQYETDYGTAQRNISADMSTMGINANTLQSVIGVATGLMTGSWATHVAALLGYEVDMKGILFNLETRAMQFKDNLENWLNKTYTINVELNLPDLPPPPGSNSAGGGYQGNSAVSVPETNPLMPFPVMGSAAVGANITGVGVMNVQNGMDVAVLRTLIIQTIQEALT